MKKQAGFTLIELLVVLAVIGSLLAISYVCVFRFKDSLEYSRSIGQIVSDIKLTQQLADTSYQVCMIEFTAGKNTYRIMKGGDLYRSRSISRRSQFSGKSYFSFVPSGYTDVGGSGTLFVNGTIKSKKIVVSSRGRIRVE